MEQIFDHEFLGSEFDWVAIDREWHIGFFSTAGDGWLPSSLITDPEPYLASLDLIKALPKCSPVSMIAPVSHSIVDWIDVAERGLFAFDWNRRTKRYELVAAPAIPSLVSTNGENEILTLARRTRFDCSFSTGFPHRRNAV